MYFPYLRARLFELIALRELVNEDSIQDKIIPVLEPVKDSFNNLSLAHNVFKNKNFKAYLIVNPLQGEQQGDTQIFLDYISGLENSNFLPAFHYSDNSSYIYQQIKDYKLNNCLIICFENFTDDDNLKDLLTNPSVTHVMLIEPHKYRNLDRFIKKLNKFYIRLDDLFEKQQKNANYLAIPAHKFTEEHLYYAQDGYQGFSDFTVLPSEYTEGGSTPRAVVIHLTYLNTESEDEIWIRHFTSETNDSISDVQGKFAQAAEKAINYCTAQSISNSAIKELKEYFDNTRYPGLGTVKKISIKNHLLTIRSYL